MNNMENLPISDFEIFKKQVDDPNFIICAKENDKNIIQVRKNLILSYLSDTGGCGFIRNFNPMAYINFVFGRGAQIHTVVTTFFIFQPDVLINTRTLFFQRMMSASQLERIEQYKRMQPQFKYKMIWEIDDNIWGHNELQGGTKEEGIPIYNFGSEKIDDAIKSVAIKTANLMDLVTCSTEYLKKILIDNGVKVEIKVVPNTVPMYFYGNKKRETIKEKIDKPKILYTGSPTHYHNGKELLGDWENSWLEYIIKNVKDDKIDFLCMGGLPFFFKPLIGKSNFHVTEWQNSYRYHLVLLDYQAHFSIGPLVINQFNRAKSDLKAIESYATGSLFIGTIFKDKTPSPYDECFIKLYNDCSVQEIENVIEEYSSPEKFNDVLDKQYNYILQNNRYTESPGYINYLMSIL